MAFMHRGTSRLQARGATPPAHKQEVQPHPRTHTHHPSTQARSAPRITRRSSIPASDGGAPSAAEFAAFARTSQPIPTHHTHYYTQINSSSIWKTIMLPAGTPTAGDGDILKGTSLGFPRDSGTDSTSGGTSDSTSGGNGGGSNNSSSNASNHGDSNNSSSNGTREDEPLLLRTTTSPTTFNYRPTSSHADPLATWSLVIDLSPNGFNLGTLEFNLRNAIEKRDEACMAACLTELFRHFVYLNRPMRRISSPRLDRLCIKNGLAYKHRSLF